MAIDQNPTASAGTATEQDGLGFIIAKALRAAAAPGQSPQQQKATEAALVKALRSLKLNEEQAKAMAKALIDQPAEIMAKTLILMQKFADGQADMSIKAANEWMDANIRQGKSVMGIVNIARFFSTVARYFGAEAFAQTLDERSDAITADAKKYFDRIPAEQLATQGREIAERAFRDQLVFQLNRSKETADAIAQGTQTANRAQPAPTDGVTGQQDAPPPPSVVPSSSPSAATGAQSKITRGEFQAEIFRITGNRGIAERVTKQTFDPAANLPGGQQGIIDGAAERPVLVDKVGKATPDLSDSQRAELYKWMAIKGLNVPKGPIETVAADGPR
jgi:hypothetical protein